jgi:hypothetical protein
MSGPVVDQMMVATSAMMNPREDEGVCFIYIL